MRAGRLSNDSEGEDVESAGGARFSEGRERVLIVSRHHDVDRLGVPHRSKALFEAELGIRRSAVVAEAQRRVYAQLLGELRRGVAAADAHKEHLVNGWKHVVTQRRRVLPA